MSSFPREVLLKVKVAGGRQYEERRTKVEVEVGDILKKMQEFCELSNEEAKYFSLYTIEKATSGQATFPQKIFVDQRTSSRKLFHHFNPKDSIWELFYGIKYYSWNLLNAYETNDSLKMFYLHQIHEDIENGLISLQYCSKEEVKTLIFLFHKAAGQKKIGQNFVFHENLMCKSVMAEVSDALYYDFLHKSIGHQPFGEWHKSVLELPGYGEHPFVGYVHKDAVKKWVIFAGNNKGICIRDFYNFKSQDFLVWEDVYKVSYKSSIFVIKHFYPPEQNKKKVVFHMDKKRYAKSAWKSIVDLHGFYRLKRFEARSLPLQVLLDRKSNFRHFLSNTDRQGKHVIENKNEHQWGVILQDTAYDVASDLYQVEVKLCCLPTYDNYHYSIIEDTIKQHCIYELDKVHLCVEAST